MKLFKFIVLTTLILSCKTVKVDQNNLSRLSEVDCTSPISLVPYLSASSPGQLANPDAVLLQLKDRDVKRGLYKKVPCNSVKLFSHANDSAFSSKEQNRWLATEQRFFEDNIDKIIADPIETAILYADAPFKRSPMHRAISETITNAKHTLYINFMLYGGAWGAEILREVLVAMKKNPELKVFYQMDITNRFASAMEIIPIEKALRQLTQMMPNFAFLPSYVDNRPSAIPLNLYGAANKLAQVSSAVPFFPDLKVPSGKSDHTKIIIADAFQEQPTVFTGSKNVIDAGSFHFDESIVLSGLGAAVVQCLYLDDITQSFVEFGAELDQTSRKFVSSLIADIADRTKPNGKKVSIRNGGTTTVSFAENSAGDKVRNVDHYILDAILKAEKSVKIYAFLAYNPALLEALSIADAKFRKKGILDGVKVILDTGLGYSLNTTLPLYLQMVWSKQIKEGEGNLLEDRLAWRRLLPRVNFNQKETRADLVQQQHTKSIIIDDETLILGTANFDVATFSGSFREIVIGVEDPNIAKSAAALFDASFANRDNQNAEVLSTQQAFETVEPKPFHKLTQAAVIRVMVRQMLMMKSFWPTDFNYKLDYEDLNLTNSSKPMQSLRKLLKNVSFPPRSPGGIEQDATEDIDANL